MNYGSYEKYKDSRVAWLGRIPENWHLMRLNESVKIKTSNVDKKTKEGEESVRLCNYVDVYYNEKITSAIKFMNASATTVEIEKFKLNKGDVVLTKDSESPSDIGVPTLIDDNIDDLVCGYHLAVLKSIPDKTYGSYIYYAIKSHSSAAQFEVLANGVTRFGLSQDDLKNLLIALPSVDQQKIIADFLDKKTAEIDDLITKKEELLKLLPKQLDALITNTVTKGLNSSSRIKDSGLDCLSKIPATWEVKKIRYVGSFQNGVSNGSDYFGSGSPFVSYGDVYNNFSLPKDIKGLAMSSDIDKERYSVEEGDVFFTRTSETAEDIGTSSICLNTIKDAVFSGFLIRFRPKKEVLFKKFSQYYFRSNITRFFFVKEMNIVTRVSLSQDLLKDLPILLPPISEQKVIANFLDKKTIEADKSIKKIKEAIERLKEYRTSLITNAVTGKINVQNFKTDNKESL